MSTEPTAAEPDGALPSMQRLVIEALARGGDGQAAMKEILAHAPMAADQRSLLELLLSANQDGSTEAVASGPEPAVAEPEDGRAERRISALRQELADLREVNDTVARALGACPACWGGDATCPECKGHGGAGSRTPDPALFRELVVPAVRRVRSLQPRAARPASRRSRIDGSREWRHSDEW